MDRFGAGAQEQHFFPSSLKFNLNIVTSEGFFNVSSGHYNLISMMKNRRAV